MVKKVRGMIILSPPSRRRGLKSPLWHIPHLTPVASFTEAWIEIEAATLDGETLGSPPSRRRGLKSCQEMFGRECL